MHKIVSNGIVYVNLYFDENIGCILCSITFYKLICKMIKYIFQIETEKRGVCHAKGVKRRKNKDGKQAGNFPVYSQPWLGNQAASFYGPWAESAHHQAGAADAGGGKADYTWARGKKHGRAECGVVYRGGKKLVRNWNFPVFAPLHLRQCGYERRNSVHEARRLPAGSA